MMQGDSEWVYYLRCKETERSQPMGIRRIIPLVENSVALVLKSQGISREYNGTFSLNASFWKALSATITNELEKASGEKKVVSKLSLDRGAPRKRKP
jgi:hypothetical protein